MWSTRIVITFVSRFVLLSSSSQEVNHSPNGLGWKDSWSWAHLSIPQNIISVLLKLVRELSITRGIDISKTHWSVLLHPLYLCLWWGRYCRSHSTFHRSWLALAHDWIQVRFECLLGSLIYSDDWWRRPSRRSHEQGQRHIYPLIPPPPKKEKQDKRPHLRKERKPKTENTQLMLMWSLKLNNLRTKTVTDSCKVNHTLLS